MMPDDGWRKSSYSSHNNCCVEWRKSTYSSASNCCLEWRKSTYSSDTANCVEVSTVAEVHVRDSKNRDGGILTFPPESWAAFIAGVQTGEFGLITGVKENSNA